MNLLNITSPHNHSNLNTATIMRQVCCGLLPGIVILMLFFGWGTLFQVIIAVATGIATEAIILSLRGKPIKFYLTDYSVVVTSLLLAVAIPPMAPWWLIMLGVIFAVAVAKHIYGGLGSNPFNPAMAGYVFLLISFPVPMTSWILPATPWDTTLIQNDFSIYQLNDVFKVIFLNDASQNITHATGATALDTLKTAARANLTWEEVVITQTNLFSDHLNGIAIGWTWVNCAFLLGGLFLLYQRTISWHIPVTFLTTLAILATIGFFVQRNNGSPIFHLLSGSTMLGAFFIATDPVSAATSRIGKIYYAMIIAGLVYLIRIFGGYPDAMAFAVLLANLLAPTLDFYTTPRTYGHSR